MNLRLTLPSGVRWSPVLVAGLACAALAAATVVTDAVPILVSAFMPGSRAAQRTAADSRATSADVAPKPPPS
ncbi:MAG: hypothetical protein ACKOJI_10380, partial [Phycisphaerales bacterium]